MPDVAPGKEEEFRRLQRSLALSDRLDRLIEASERLDAAAQTVRDIAPASPVAGGLRAGFASRLARVALALHRQAAAEAVLRQETESLR